MQARKPTTKIQPSFVDLISSNNPFYKLMKTNKKARATMLLRTPFLHICACVRISKMMINFVNSTTFFCSNREVFGETLSLRVNFD